MPSTHASPAGHSAATLQERAHALVVPKLAQVAPSPQVAEVAHGLLQVPTVEPEGMTQVSEGSRKQSAIDLHGLPRTGLVVPVLVSPPPSPGVPLSCGHGVPSPQLAKPPTVEEEHPAANARTPTANPIQR